MVCPASGYKVIRGTELLNGMWLLQKREISFRAFRVYLACFSLVAIREAASRVRRKSGRDPHIAPAYRISELSRATGAREGEVRYDLRRLKEVGLLNFRAGEITSNREPLAGTEALAALVRSPGRPIPVPRAALRFVAATRKRALVLAALTYMLRGLTIDRQTGEVRGKGSAKRSWVAAVSGLSERAAAYARAELIKAQFLSADESSTQRKLNRHGAYFAINLDFSRRPNGEGRRARRAAEAPSNFAPLAAADPPVFAPPYKEKKTSSIEESKNQKAPQAEPDGVYKQESPTFRRVRPEHLRNFSDMERLYFDACSRGVIVPSEASALNFLSAAIKARSVSTGDPVRIFVSIVRRRLWHHITQNHEDEARKVLLRFREKNPERFRFCKAAA